MNAKKSSPWAPYRGAVSLTFDDGTDNQLDVALPLLDQHGLRATFYLHARDHLWHQRRERWQAVAAAGHEIGNHTLSHWCPDNLTRRPGGLEERTLAEVEADLLAAQARLQQLAPQQGAWTFAYPCYSTFVGRGEARRSYVPLVAQHFLAGRAGGEYGFGNDPAVVDLACLWGLAAERMTGFEMIGLVDELAREGLWLILVFHDISGSRLSVDRDDFLRLLEHLQRRADTIWTAPVVEIAGALAAWRAAAATL